MSRNLKPDYIRNLINTKAPNGYRFDVTNYLYNPDMTYNYPVFKRLTETRDGREFYREVGYSKHYDGNGEYFVATFSRDPNGNSWQFIKDYQRTTITESRRFSLKTLLSYCE